MADPAAAAVVKGLGVQWAGKSALPVIRNRFPDIAIWGSEQECGIGTNDWHYARYGWDTIRQYFAVGATAWTYWNMVMPTGGMSGWGWPQNSMIVVDPVTKSWRLTHDYWLIRHLAGSVRPGARAIPVDSFWLQRPAGVSQSRRLAGAGGRQCAGAGAAGALRDRGQGVDARSAGGSAQYFGVAGRDVGVRFGKGVGSAGKGRGPFAIPFLSALRVVCCVVVGRRRGGRFAGGLICERTFRTRQQSGHRLEESVRLVADRHLYTCE
jgi:hypothetical protein